MKMYPTLQRITLLLFFGLGLGFASQAQDFTYSPVNPAFGGNALNYGWMLNSATAQNSINDPDSDSRPTGRDQLQSFTESLERQLLSQISREIFSSQFGSDGLEEGTYSLGNYQVDITSGLDGLIITINDFSTGGATQITVPFF